LGRTDPIDSPPEGRDNQDMLAVEVHRGTEDDSRFDTFYVPMSENQSVLDVVTHIQRFLDPGLAYRFACRVGVCGSCAMTVNGIPRWTCRTHVSRVSSNGTLRIGPLKNLPVIRDLVTDMTDFFEKWQKARGRFVEPSDSDTVSDNLGSSTTAASNKSFPVRGENGLYVIPPDGAARSEANAAIECINCGVCYSACDVVRWRSDYFGPAALNRAWAALNDERDGDHEGLLRMISSNGGCHNCHSHQSCATHCPVELNPTQSIAGLKKASVKASFRAGRQK